MRNSSSVSRWNDCRRLPSHSGESGRALRSSRSSSHWPAKLSTSASALGSASIRRTCRSSTAGSFSVPRPASASSSVVGNAAPEEERQPRRELDSRPAGTARPARRSPVRARTGTGTADRRARAPPRAGCRDSNVPRSRPARKNSTAACPCPARWPARDDDTRATASACRIVRAHVVSSAADAGEHDEQPPAARRVARSGGIERPDDRDLRDAGRRASRRGRRCRRRRRACAPSSRPRWCAARRSR